MKSYLSNRKQFTNVASYSSTYNEINTGVPQGSNLGPLLFLIYMNDLPFVSEILSSILFADDTTLFLTGKDPVIINDLLNIEFRKIYRWFNANKLLINFDKTNYVIFKTRNKRFDESAINIFVDGKEIKKSNCVKFLGIYIDCDLTWKNHINHISSKIARVIGVINRLKHVLPIRILLNLYNTMILPDLNYCIILWGSCASYLFQKVFVLQKKGC